MIPKSECQSTSSGITAEVIAPRPEEPVETGVAYTSQSSKISLLKKLRGKKFLAVSATALIIVLAVAVLSYYLFEQKTELAFLQRVGDVVKQFNALNDTLIARADEKLENDRVSAELFKSYVEQDKREIITLQQEMDGMKPNEKYANQYNHLKKVLDAEFALLQQTSLILSNPFSSEADHLLSTVKTNIAETKQIAAEVQLPDMELHYSDKMTLLPVKLSLYVDEMRKQKKERETKLVENVTFFKEMDSIIEQYDGSKKDLGAMLDIVRQGGKTWGEYSQIINDAKADRKTLRYRLSQLPAPKGTESLKTNLSSILTRAIYYCEVMDTGVKMELTSYMSALAKYDEATAVNAKIQKEYASFLQEYQAQKEAMTNPETI